MSDFISRQKISYVVESLGEDYISQYKMLILINQMPSVEPDRKFLEIVVEYPKICTYPEYEGKPYYSIKYEENGEIIVGFGTYKPEVLSQYLKDYFIPSAESERKKGKWQRRKGSDCWECSQCHAVLENNDLGMHNFYFCYHCGANMMNRSGYMDIEEVHYE